MDLQNAINLSKTDNLFRNELLKNPSRIFLPIELQKDTELTIQFNKFADTEIKPLIMRAGIDGLPDLSCAACKTGAFLIAAAIVAAAAAGLSALTLSSTVVLQLAAFASVSTTTALAFIVSLAATIAGGVSEVVNAICNWMDVC